jgi:DNA-binding transcriptional LysR family regulator
MMNEPFIGMQRDSAIMRLYRQKAEAIGCKVRERAYATGFDSLRKMVAAGLGISILPTAAAEDVPGTVLRPLAEDWARRKLSICVRDPKLLSAAGKLLLDHLIDTVHSSSQATGA